MYECVCLHVHMHTYDLCCNPVTGRTTQLQSWYPLGASVLWAMTHRWHPFTEVAQSHYAMPSSWLAAGHSNWSTGTIAPTQLRAEVPNHSFLFSVRKRSFMPSVVWDRRICYQIRGEEHAVILQGWRMIWHWVQTMCAYLGPRRILTSPHRMRVWGSTDITSHCRRVIFFN